MFLVVVRVVVLRAWKIFRLRRSIFHSPCRRRQIATWDKQRCGKKRPPAPAADTGRGSDETKFRRKYVISMQYVDDYRLLELYSSSAKLFSDRTAPELRKAAVAVVESAEGFASSKMKDRAVMVVIFVITIFSVLSVVLRAAWSKFSNIWRTLGLFVVGLIVAAGVVLTEYLLIFSAPTDATDRMTAIFDGLYKINDDATMRAYREQMLKDGEATIGDEPNKRKMGDVILDGLRSTITWKMARRLESTIEVLRKWVSMTEGRPEPHNVMDVIEDLVVPMMVEEVTSRNLGGLPTPGGAETECATYCESEVEDIARSLKGGVPVSSQRVEEAWVRCGEKMRQRCDSMEDAGQKCAMGCNSTRGAPRGEIRLTGYAPSQAAGSSWTAMPGLTMEACVQLADNTAPRSNACMFNGACYVQSATGNSGEFVSGSATDVTTVMYADKNRLVLPEKSDAAAVDRIFEEMKRINGALDIGAMQGALYRELESADPGFLQNKEAYSRLFSGLVDRLNRHISEEEREPWTLDVGEINNRMSKTTGRMFRAEVILPVVDAAVVMELIASRCEKPYLVPDEGRKRMCHDMTNYVVFVASAAVAAAILYAVVFMEAKGGFFETLLKEWNSVAVVTTVVIIVLVLMFSGMERGFYRDLLELRKSADAAKELLARLVSLRDYLLQMTGNRITTDAEKAAAKNALHTGNNSYIKQVAKADLPLSQILTPVQRMGFMSRATDVVMAYKRFSKDSNGPGVPFPYPEVLSYLILFGVTVLGKVYIDRVFSVGKITKLVGKLRGLVSKLREGDASALPQALLAVSGEGADSASGGAKILRDAGAILVVGAGLVISMTVLGSNADYSDSLNALYMIMLGG